MLIVYCEKCGARVPDAPQDAPPGTIYCKDCVIKVDPYLADAKLPHTQPKGSGRLTRAQSR